MNKKNKINRRIRSIVQLFFFLLIGAIAINHTLAARNIYIPFISDASLHAICPLGGIVSIYNVFTANAFIQKIHESSFVIMLIIFILTIGFGAVFCGWICPFGTVQEWIGKLGKKLFKTKYNNMLPKRLDKYLRYLRYLVLAWVLYVTAVSSKLIFSDYDPFYALFNFWSGEVSLISIALLLLFLGSALFIERPWCKYACPLGAVYGLGNIIRIFKIRRNASTCIGCTACDKACPMNINISEKSTIRDHQCISCLRCTSDVSCPIKDTVNLVSKGGK